MKKYYAIEIIKIKNHKMPCLFGPYLTNEIQKETIRQMKREGKEVYYLDSTGDCSVGRVLMIEGDPNS